MEKVVKTVDFLLALIKSEVTGDRNGISKISDSDIENLIELALKHDLTAIVANALIENNIVDKESSLRKKMERILVYSSYRYLRNKSLCEKTENILYENNIDYVLLKGSVIRDMYPEPWMRSSCDTDILIHEKDIEKAIVKLVENGFKTENRKNYHDVALYYNNALLELHFSICENMSNIDKLLKRVWDYVKKVNRNKYLETNDFFVFHHIAHMMYHFVSGGCGIRPFIDLWILRRNNFYNESEVEKQCDYCGILKFYKSILEVVDVWFGGAVHNEKTLRIQNYIVYGGVYGSLDNVNAVGVVKNRSKIGYLFKLVFLPYTNMRVLYPNLNKYPFLLPFYYIKRIFIKIFGADKNRAKSKFSNIKNQNSEFVDEVARLMVDIGLK